MVGPARILLAVDVAVGYENQKHPIHMMVSFLCLDHNVILQGKVHIGITYPVEVSCCV
jgi:hypothetical protein